MNLRGQGSIEYLLLIGGAVLIAMLVTLLLLNASEAVGVSVLEGVESYYTVTTGGMLCNGEFTIRTTNISLNPASASIVDFDIPGGLVLRKVILDQQDYETHFDQTYNVSIDSTLVWSVADTSTTTGQLVSEDLSFPMSAGTHQLMLDRTGPFEVNFETTLIFCTG